MAVTQAVEARTDIATQNLLVNGGFELWQRGAGPFVSTGGDVYTADEWMIDTSGSMQVDREGTIKQSGDYALKLVNSGGVNAWCHQSFENYESLEGRWLTLSMDVWCDTASAAYIRITDYTGTFEFSNVPEHPGDSAWHRLTAYKQVRTGLTTNTGAPHQFGLSLSAWLAANATMYIDNAMCVVGYHPEGVAFVPLHPADDLERAQRFFETSGINRLHGFFQDISNNRLTRNYFLDRVAYKARKQATPTVTTKNLSYVQTPRSGGFYFEGGSTQVGFGYALRDSPANDDKLYCRCYFDWDAEVA
jgi:hypothetical protein